MRVDSMTQPAEERMETRVQGAEKIEKRGQESGEQRFRSSLKIEK
jgi:hypothetical protein